MPTIDYPYTGLVPSCPNSVPRQGKLRTQWTYNRVGDRKRTRPRLVDLMFSPTSIWRSSSSIIDSLTLEDVPYECMVNNAWKKISLPVVCSMYENTGIGAPLAPSNFNDFNATYSRLMAKIKDEKVSLGVMAGEYRETVSMFVATATHILDTYRSIRRGRTPRWVHSVQRNKLAILPSSVLCYNFGISPLIGDVQSIVDHWDSVVSGLRPRKKVTVNSATVHRNSRTILTGEYFKAVRIDETTVSSTITAHVEYLPHQSVATQLGLTNPVAVAWELVPFSFLLDYVLSVGDWLATFDALNGVSRYAFYYTTRGECLQTNLHGSTVIRGSARHYARTVFSPSIRLGTPQWKPSLSYKQIENICALTASFLNHHR